MASGVLARARIVLEGDSAALTRTLRDASASMSKAGRRMTSIGKGISTKVTLPILAMGVGAVRAFASFDDAMQQSIAIMGDVSETMRGKMSEAAREVARTTTTSSTKAAESFFFLASAGLTAEQSIAALPQVAAFAQAGMFSMATATDLATDAQSALGLTVDDAAENLINLTRVTDVLVKANTLANASVLQFSEALTREAGATLKTFKIDIEEGVAVLAAFADQGVKGQIAGSGLARILRLMSNAATKHNVELKELGIAVFDDTGKIRNFADVVADMEDAFGGMSDEARTAALESIGFTARVQGILLPLLGTSGAIRQYEKDLDDAGGTTQRVADVQLESFSSQMKLVWNQIVLAADAAAGTLEPAMRAIAQVIRDAARAFEEMDTGTQRAIVVMLGLVAVVGPGLIVVGGMTLALAKLTTGLKLLLVPTANATRALVLFRAVVSPGSLLLVGIAALVVKLFTLQAAAGRAAREMKEANQIFEDSLSLFSAEKAAKTIEGLDRVINGLKDRVTNLNRELVKATATQGFMADATGNVASAAIRAAEGEKLSVDQLQAMIAATKESIVQHEAHRDILGVVAGLAEDAGGGGEGGKGGEGGANLERLKETMAELAETMAALTRMSQLFGDNFDLASEQASALESSIQDLVIAGADFDAVVGPEGETLSELVVQLLDLRAGIEAAKDAQVALTAAEEEAKAVFESVMTPLEIYNATYARLVQLLETTELGQEAFNRAVAAAQGVLEDATEQGESWGETMKQAADNALNSFVTFTTGAGASFKGFIDEAIRDLQRLTIRLAVKGIVEAVLNAAASKSGGGGGGGGGGGKQHGGFIPGGQFSLVGEAGPELVRAGRGGVTVQPLRGMEFSGGGGGGGAQVALTINAVDARSFSELVEANPSAITEPFIRALRRSSVLGKALVR